MTSTSKMCPKWVLNDIDSQLIDLAFIEDLGLPYQDITTHLLFSTTQTHAKASVISKHPTDMLLCGLPVVDAILKKLTTYYVLETNYGDGDIVSPGSTLLTLSAPPQLLLMVERLILNFLQRLCAIATLTASFVNLIKKTPTQLLDTRKTIPGFRHLEKYAVCCGGGVNHRMGLYDAVMIKDTHIDLLGGIDKAIAKLPNNITQQHPVIVEVRNLYECEWVINHGLHKVTRLLLDNMPIKLLADCVKRCDKLIPTEASGNINSDTILSVAECGVDFISIGRLTHSAKHVDLSMQCKISMPFE